MAKVKPLSLSKIIIATILALIAFASNSVLCRLALGSGLIDPSGFTTTRLLSGALILMLILGLKKEPIYVSERGSWMASAMLFLYAITFSFAYVTLDTGTGALILFGSVQTTMIILSLFSGNRLHLSEWIGMFTAFFGFVYLVLPGLSTPSITGFGLMSISGMAWGVYTLKGRGSKSPLQDTATNFIRTVPLAIVLAIILLGESHYSTKGLVYAALSGGIASGLGYSIWYLALGGLSATQAAVLQLSVPVIAALGGVLFVGELITLRLSVSGLIILGGILIVVLGRYYFVQLPEMKSLEQNSASPR